MRATPGGTNYSAYFYITEDLGGTNPGEPKGGLVFGDLTSASYMRQGGARVAITPITLASASAAHSDGGFILVDDTNMKGLYRLDLPDAAIAAGVDFVIASILIAGASNAVASPLEIELTAQQTGDNFARLGAPAGASVSADNAAIKSDTAAILVDTADMQPKLGTPAADLSADIAAVKVDTAAILVDTADMQPKLGTPAADVSADIAAVKADTAAILVDTGTTLPDRLTGIEGATFVTGTDSLEAIRNRGDAAWITATGFSTHSAADVWTAATRTLTAATNITSDGAAINATAGVINTVNLVNTTSVNSDMRGTDGANTVVPDNAGIASNGAAIAALNDISAADVLTAQFVESYAADGVAPTLTESLMLVQQMLTDFVISGVTMTVRELDGVATAATLTLNDGTNPTGITRTG